MLCLICSLCYICMCICRWLKQIECLHMKYQADKDQWNAITYHQGNDANKTFYMRKYAKITGICSYSAKTSLVVPFSPLRVVYVLLALPSFPARTATFSSALRSEKRNSLNFLIQFRQWNKTGETCLGLEEVCCTENSFLGYIYAIGQYLEDLNVIFTLIRSAENLIITKIAIGKIQR